MTSERSSLCIVGLGYVGLPLAHAFAKAGYTVSGYDVSENRIKELSGGHDRTNELTDEQLQEVTITYSADPAVISESDIVIVAVPTPIDDEKIPDLKILKAASKTVGENLKAGQIIVFESTVYPGTTEEICGPILEAESGLTSGKDFKLGYSPERINPGDKEHTVAKIVKVVAGQDDETTDQLCELYETIVEVGVHRAESIKVAEMAKAIENAQRDLNIAFINEVAMMCNKIDIPTQPVLAAAGTKWNFLRFQPGLVGGHCIGVDPYYLVEKAKQLGMDTHVITAGRSVNDGMGAHVADQIVQALAVPADSARILILGITFKENVPDRRNSKVIDVSNALLAAGCEVVAHDPYHTAKELETLGYQAGSLDDQYDAVALLVPHREYLDSQARLIRALKPDGVLYDLKGVLNDTGECTYRTL